MSSNTAPDCPGVLFVKGNQYPVHTLEMSHDHLGFHLRAHATLPRDHVELRPQSFEDRGEKARRELIDFAKTGAPPEPYGFFSASPPAHPGVPAFTLVENFVHRLNPVELELALRNREAAFEESVLPRGATVLPPRELYAEDMWPERTVPRMKEQKPWQSDDTIITNLRCDKHGSYTGKPGDTACPHCPKGEFVCYCHRELGDKYYTTRGCFLGSCDRKDPRPASLTDFAREVHADNAHWWHDPATGKKLDRNMGEMLMLVVSEIAECMEGERKDLMDDHLPHRKMAEVELADAVIRIADIAGSKGYDLNAPRDKTMDVPSNKGQALFRIARAVMRTAECGGKNLGPRLARAVALIEVYAEKHGYDLWGAVAEKREYNRHRADHKAEARLAPNGKKF